MTDENKYRQLLIYAIIYFFLNSFLLPHGMLYTTILTPVMVYYLVKIQKLRMVFIWGILLLIPIPFQVITGVEAKSFLISNIILATCLTFMITSFYLLSDNAHIISRLFRKVLIINTFFVAVAIMILPFEAVRSTMWYDIPITVGLELIPRLKLFTYEASYYSLIMMPVFLYYLLRVFYGIEKHKVLIFLATIIPLLFSLSFGVLGAILIAGITGVVVYWRLIPISLKRTAVYSSITLIALSGILYLVWPENPVYFRLDNIFSGTDTSAMGRLVYSFMFAKDIIIQNNILFGTGPGQIKILAHDMIINHYKYHGVVDEVVRIPNSMAEMLAIYGIYGFTVKLFLEIFFFVKYRIYRNLYSTILFIFIFIYQFTGSFITNVAELGIWIIVFGVRFSEFEFDNKTN